MQMVLLHMCRDQTERYGALTDSGEPGSDGGLLADLAEEAGLAVLADVVCHFKVPESTCTNK